MLQLLGIINNQILGVEGLTYWSYSICRRHIDHLIFTSMEKKLLIRLEVTSVEYAKTNSKSMASVLPLFKALLSHSLHLCFENCYCAVTSLPEDVLLFLNEPTYHLPHHCLWKFFYLNLNFHEWPKQDFSLQYQYHIKQKHD